MSIPVEESIAKIKTNLNTIIQTIYNIDITLNNICNEHKKNKKLINKLLKERK